MFEAPAGLAKSAAQAPGWPKSVASDPSIASTLTAVRSQLSLDVAFVSRFPAGEWQEFTHVDAEGDLLELKGMKIPVDKGYCWHVLNGELPAIIPNAAENRLAAGLELTEAMPVGCYIGVSLHLADGTPIGSLGVVGLKPDPSLNPRDLRVVEAFARLVERRIEDAIVREREDKEIRKSVIGMLDGQAISVFQQPILSIADHRIWGVECLARFPNATRRGPDSWFEDAARVGLRARLERTALDCALETLSHLPEGMRAAINISPETIACGALEEALAGIDTSALVIEVTNHDQVEDAAALRDALDKVRGHALVSVDNVGTGSEGLAKLVELQPDIVKIDMALTRDIDARPAGRALTGAVVGFAGQTGCKLVAEGVETEQELATLRDMGIDYAQGYLISRPLPVVAARQFLLEGGIAALATEPQRKSA